LIEPRLAFAPYLRPNLEELRKRHLKAVLKSGLI
jgi:hypothetical protein